MAYGTETETLTGAAETGDLKIRVIGQYGTFDVTAGIEDIASADLVGEIGAGMIVAEKIKKKR